MIYDILNKYIYIYIYIKFIRVIMDIKQIEKFYF